MGAGWENHKISWEDLRADVNRTSIRAAQYRQMFAQSRPGMYGTAIGSVVLTVVLWNEVQHRRLIAWVGIFLVLQLARLLMMSRYTRSQPSDHATLSWGRWFLLGSVSTASLWGLSAVVLFPESSFVHQCLLAIILAGVGASTAVAHAPVTECYVSSLLLTALPVLGRFLNQGGEIGFTLSFLLILFVTAVIGAVRSFHQMITQSIALRFEKDKLVESLEKARDELESRVDERTMELAAANEDLIKEIADRKLLEQRFREHVELLPEVVYEHDERGVFTFVNQRGCEITGYTRHDFDRGLSLVDLIEDQSRTTIQENISKALAGESVGLTECVAVRKDGTSFPVMVRAAPIVRDGGIVGLRGILVDVTERKEAEEALRKSEDRYRTLFEQSRDAIAITSQDGWQVDVNQAFVDLFGYERHEIMSLNARHLWADPKERAVWQKTLDSEKFVHDYPWLALRKGGEIRYCLVTSSIREDEDGTIQYQSICRDVTERKRAEELLLRSEEKYRLIFENSPLGVFHFDRAGVITACNDNFVSIIGSSREHLIGFDAVRDAGDDAMAAAIRKSLSGGIGHYEDYYASVTSDKTTPMKCEFGPVYDREGCVVGGIGIVEDITERKQAEDNLRESEEKYRNILETITDGYHEVDLEGNLTLVNDSLCEILNYSREELLGVNYREFMDPQNAKLIYSAYHEVFTTGRPNPGFNHQILRKDGTARDVSVSIALMKDSDGRPCGFRGIYRDITDRKLLEEQLRQAAKMEAIGQLAGGIAHDFNNLLTAMIGYSNMLMQEVPQTPRYQEKLAQIRRAAERAAALTQQLLAFGRKQVLDTRLVNLNTIISDLEEMLRRLIGENIEIVTLLDPDIGMIQADPGQIDQILMNLAVNARDAMPQGGRMAIETARVTLDEEYSRSHPEVAAGEYVMVSVIDTGRGMDDATVSHIFDPFFTTKEKGVGTGLGLSTVYGIVKQHQGHVSVYSEIGCGTVFKVYLPRRTESANLVPKQPTQRSKPGGEETVLVVEDETVVRDLACEALGILGYSALAAADPQEAMAISDNHPGPIHLLLTDVILPVMDGRTLHTHLAESRPGLKALFMSGYTEDFIVHHGVLDRDVHFLRKPFTMDNLAHKIRSALDEGA